MYVPTAGDMHEMAAMSQVPLGMQYMGMQAGPTLYCAGPQMWAPPFGIPPLWYGSPPGQLHLGALFGQAAATDLLAQTPEGLERQAAQLMAMARRAKAAARQARNSTSSQGSIGADALWAQGSGQDAVPPRAQQRRSSGAVGFAGGRAPEASEEAGRTTVMLRNLPNDYTRNMLLKLLDDEGFRGCYNFVYLPMDFKRMAGLGYAFVNMETHEDATRVWRHFAGFQQWTLQSMKVCEVAWGEPLQGLEAHIDRYRNSPVMHEDVPEEFKPVLFSSGERTAFPGPTKRIRPPRMKYRTPAESRSSLSSVDSTGFDGADARFVD